jgi:uncharacterized protein (DUF1778 family)
MKSSPPVNTPKPTRRAVNSRELELSIADSVTFADALLNPKPVNARLRETVRRYRAETGV